MPIVVQFPVQREQEISEELLNHTTNFSYQQCFEKLNQIKEKLKQTKQLQQMEIEVEAPKFQSPPKEAEKNPSKDFMNSYYESKKEKLLLSSGKK